mgnify:CR=1 FL=1
MRLNKLKVRELMDTYANGRYREFARLLGIDVAQVHRTLGGTAEAGPKFLGALMTFCAAHELDFNDYIFLATPLHTCNDEHAATIEPEPKPAA